MLYKIIGLMSGSSLDGIDLAYVEFIETADKWQYKIIYAETIEYSSLWKKNLQSATTLMAKDFQVLNSAYGHLLGTVINNFISKNNLSYKVDLIASHGHTIFHLPNQNTTVQIGEGAAIASKTGISVANNFRVMDVALNGQGAPIVPIGEKYLFNDYSFFLNLGGIANITIINEDNIMAFDVCPANRVLNLLASDTGKNYDEGGLLASSGTLNEEIFKKLNENSYYRLSPPKSLANEFGVEEIYPYLKSNIKLPNDALCTYVEHIAFQIFTALKNYGLDNFNQNKIFITGGGAHNTYLIDRINYYLKKLNLTIFIPEKLLIDYKEAIIIAFMGVLRWRQQPNVLSSVTGALRNSVGGSLWLGD